MFLTGVIVAAIGMTQTGWRGDVSVGMGVLFVILGGNHARGE